MVMRPSNGYQKKERERRMKRSGGREAEIGVLTAAKGKISKP